MPRIVLPRSRVLAPALVALTLLVSAGCGDAEATSRSGDKNSGGQSAGSGAGPDTGAGEGSWLLGMSSAGGADGETSTTTYLSYDPSTGSAAATELPGVKAASASADQGVLLVSTDRAWAIPDTAVPRAEGRSGKLTVYSLGSGSPRTRILDIAARTGRSDVEAIGWAFDPQRPDTLRVVDTRNRVWAVAVPGGRASQETPLPKGAWVFLNGFNHTTGLPYVESIDSDRTRPPGNGPADTSPITRSGGTVLPSGAPALQRLPENPCRQSAGFTEASGTTWVFCADEPTVKTYYLPKGAREWTAYGKPSTAIAPVAAGVRLVLPPVE